MKLPKVMVHIRLGRRIFEHMQTIQLYKSKTATAIIEDALEKGLAWYLKQAGAELGYTKENPLTWEKLADSVKLSVSPKQDDKTEQTESISNYEFHMTMYEYEKDIHSGSWPDFASYIKELLENKKISLEEATEVMNDHVRNSQRPKEDAKTKI